MEKPDVYKTSEVHEKNGKHPQLGRGAIPTERSPNRDHSLLSPFPWHHKIEGLSATLSFSVWAAESITAKEDRRTQCQISDKVMQDNKNCINISCLEKWFCRKKQIICVYYLSCNKGFEATWRLRHFTYHLSIWCLFFPKGLQSILWFLTPIPIYFWRNLYIFNAFDWCLVIGMLKNVSLWPIWSFNNY